MLAPDGANLSLQCAKVLIIITENCINISNTFSNPSCLIFNHWQENPVE